MSIRSSAVARAVLPAVLALLVLAGYTAAPPVARADSAPADPTAPASPPTVSADALPTVQIDGVVWSQAVVGNTVYAAGSFTRARPAGAPAGTQEVVRNNLLAFDIRTGELITSFAPDLNAQAMVVTASPDGSRIYVGGDFTVADGQPRYGIAAYSTATGQLIDTFRPVVGSQVRAIAATNTTVYIGGWNFGVAGGVARGFLAAFNAANGAVTSWAPVVDNTVNALAVVNNGATVVIAGHMTSLNGSAVRGLGAVNATSGATVPFAASTFTANGGNNSAFTALASDSDTLYATGYSFGGGNLEGMLAINPNGGAVKWVDDCKGDSYSVWANGAVEYLAGHAHACSNIGGFPQVGGADESLWTHYRAIAFSKQATGTVGTETGNFVGRPSPTLLTWFPSLDPGTYTGQYQGPWSVTGNSQYVVYGGEFPNVNGSRQQGLVRFALPSIAPNEVGPDAATGLVPTVTSPGAGVARLTWQATSDQDNGTLTYEVLRDGTPVGSVKATSTFWNTPTVSFVDRTAPAGQRVSYTVRASDPFGNSVTGPAAAVTIAAGTGAGGAAPDDYAQVVLTDGPSDYWRFGEASGRTVYTETGTRDLSLGTGVTLGTTGALPGRANTAATFGGTSAAATSTQAAVAGPQVFSVEAWFNTTSTAGGKLLGFGNARTGLSTSYDRHLVMNSAGRVSFGVYTGQTVAVQSPGSYNDGRWHHVVATLGPGGMALYIDGTRVAVNTATTRAQVFNGYWRVGGDQTWDGSNQWLRAAVDEVAVYPTVLSAAQVTRHNTAGRTAPQTPGNVAPTASFTATATGLGVALDASASTDADGTIASYAWDLGNGQTGTGRTASYTYPTAGTYQVKLTVTDNAGATGTVTKAVTVTSPPPAGGAIAADAFGREVTGGWGTADTGGAWTIDGTAANATVTGGNGRLTAAAGTSTSAALGFSARDVSLAADVLLEKQPAGGSSFVALGTRNNGATRYNAQLYYGTDGTVAVSLVAVVDWVETELGSFVLPEKYTAGSVLKLRFEAVGSGTTTLRAKAWPSGAAEPTAWQVAATDTTAALQTAGGANVELYVGRAATSAQTLRVDNLAVTAPGAGTPTNVAPTASFTATATGLGVALDASASTDADGTIASYAWDFGNGQTGTGRTASYTYPTAGTYQVKLTVTDDAGATGTVTKAVTVTSPPPAGGAIAADAFGREVTGGWGTADTGGAWTVSGTASNASVTGGSGRLTAAAGTSIGAGLGFSARDVSVSADVLLEKAASGGGTYASIGARAVGATMYNAQLYFGSDGSVGVGLVAMVNGAETYLGYYTLPAKYTAGTVLKLRLEAVGSGTTTLRAKLWPSGTAEPTAWQVSATDTTAALQGAGGLYTDLYISGSATAAQTLRLDGLAVTAPGATPEAPANAAPTASFASTVSGLGVALDASASTDADGTIASYAWDFGNGQTGTGRTASHTYAAAGTYQVKLTVTDDAGATGTVTKSVTVAAPPADGPLATDAFGREVTGGWGTADTGGAWTTEGTASNVAVTAGSGRLTATAGTTTGAALGVSGRDVAVQTDVTLERTPAGGGSFVSMGVRNVGATRYNTQLYYGTDGTVTISLVAVVNWAETELGSYTLPGTFAAGTVLTLRTDVTGSGTTTLNTKAWVAGTPEPTAWQVTATDATAALQAAGGVQFEIYNSSRATAAQTVRVDNLWVGAAGTRP
ncbi:PKD domain-containing protein [Geodermatophilus sp. SYSU D00815]